MSSKRKKAIRSRLTIVEAKLDAAFRSEARNIVNIGGLLRDAKELLEHGKWLPWLRERYSSRSGAPNAT